ncbi:DNA polymerase subunit gamma-2, mitochondrial [Dermatophagoides farinae]|uniref:DNA polymerase subunit gamma-2, mitochondrial n=1 Tax=Dermatophagoides farinae TaxID=6954 RepID=UPI003F634666
MSLFANFLNSWPAYCKHQVINNIVKEWKKFASKILPTKIFIASLPITDSNADDILIKSALDFYDKNLSQWISQKSSFGIIYQYPCRFQNDHEDSKFKFLHEPHINQHVSLVLFCPKSETLKLQQMLTRTRFHWYRKLSKSPMKSGFQTNLNGNENLFQIGYQPKRPIFDESITLDTIRLNCGEQNSVQDVDIISCNSNLHNCLLAFLDDCFTRNDEEKIVMKLNPQLVPFKLAINIDSDGCKAIGHRKLLEVAEHLIGLLEEYPDISIFPFTPDNPITIDQCDRLAVKYCIILTEETLRTGIIHLRNRDTTISEQIHISNLLKTILFYLQPEKLITYVDK